MNRPGKCNTISGQHYNPTWSVFALATFFSYMDAGAEKAELDLTQRFEVLPGKNNKTRKGDEGVGGV